MGFLNSSDAHSMASQLCPLQPPLALGSFALKHLLRLVALSDWSTSYIKDSLNHTRAASQCERKRKRRTPDRTKENGFDREPLHSEHPSKRPCTISPGQRYSPNNGLSYQPNGLPHPTTPPPQHYPLDDMAIAHHYRDSYQHPSHRDLRVRNRPMGLHGTRQEEMIDHRLTDREWAEEWKHLDHLLNCIMDMVEKTRQSLTVLRRCQEADREELKYWIRWYSDGEDLKKGGSSSSSHSRQQSPINPDPVTLDAHREFLHRPASGYVPEEIWKKAEEAVNEVKCQAMTELQKAVSEAERKAQDVITTERAKMQRTVAEPSDRQQRTHWQLSISRRIRVRIAGIVAVKLVKPAVAVTQPDTVAPFASTETGRSTTTSVDRPCNPAAGGHVRSQLLCHAQQRGREPDRHTTSSHSEVDHPGDPFHHRDNPSLDADSELSEKKQHNQRETNSSSSDAQSRFSICLFRDELSYFSTSARANLTVILRR
ncbi:Protein CBFA2T1 [Sciurus carolinensis]|uniref:Protein CBFA2T1 n=1 Tax=Sciurus carolinensis TaxID=30640 RepID=A0AA41NA86_SCICA|nr:Protein CBFA2T1 [Sciurus carolinensis]